MSLGTNPLSLVRGVKAGAAGYAVLTVVVLALAGRRPPIVSAVVETPVAELRPWPENPRTIDPERLEELKQAMASDPEMLWARPLLVLPDGTIVAGNQRYTGALQLGWKTVPVIRVDLSPERARLWALRDNNTYADWDEASLAELLADLQRDGVELALTGFTGAEIDRILNGIPAPVDPDEAPPLPEGEPDSVPGRVYKLGPHKLLCGDATDPAQLALLFGNEAASAVWTDPPYGVDYTGKTPKALKITNDDGGAAALLRSALEAADTVVAPSSPFYIAAPAGPQGTGFRLAVEQAGWRLHQVLVWAKNSLVLGHSDYHYAHEDVLYGWNAGPGAARPRPPRG